MIHRNDPSVNKHNRIQLQGFRSNVDLQIIMDWRACYNYIAKYAAKANKTSAPINEVLSKAIAHSDATTDSTAAFRKMAIASAGMGEKGQQEVVQLMMAQQEECQFEERFCVLQKYRG